MSLHSFLYPIKFQNISPCFFFEVKITDIKLNNLKYRLCDDGLEMIEDIAFMDSYVPAVDVDPFNLVIDRTASKTYCYTSTVYQIIFKLLSFKILLIDIAAYLLYTNNGFTNDGSYILNISSTMVRK